MQNLNNTDLIFKELKQGQNQEKVEIIKSVKSNSKSKTSGGNAFGAYNLSPNVLKAIRIKGYNLPTPIQRKAVPQILQGFNVIAMARTGSGKTGAFIIPLVEKLQCHSKIVGARAVILSPTREIAIQTAMYFKAIAKFTDLTMVLITGGNDMENQFERLLLNPDVIIATPGRLMYCLQQANMSLSQVQMVIYDEADRIFELGFAEQLYEIIKKMPKERQSLLFSATISNSVKDFTISGIKDYKMVQVDKESKLSDDLKSHFFVVKSIDKVAALLYIMQEIIDLKQKNQQSIIFAATRHHVEYLYEITRLAGLRATYIFGIMDQKSREDRLQMFRHKKVNFLIVTDLAARGIDIPLLQNVIHYDFPASLKLYIHRSGRTARAGQKGNSYSIITQDELAYAYDLSVFVGKKLQDENVEDQESAIQNPEFLTIGSIPQSTIDEYNSYVQKLILKNPTGIETMKQSLIKSLTKYNRTREQASQAGISAMRLFKLTCHPMLKSSIDEKDEYLINFRQAISQYKPKSSCLEIQINKTKDEQAIEEFRGALKQQINSQTLKIQREQMQKHYQEELDLQKEILEKNQIEMRQIQLNNQKILSIKNQTNNNENQEEEQNELSHQDIKKDSKDFSRLSKKRRLKIEKLKKNSDLTENQKQELIQQIEEEGLKGKDAQKRSKLDDFKDQSNFITPNKKFSQDNRVNSSELWGENEKNFLEDVTLNLVPDDDAVKNIKGKTAMRWDAVKKRYMLKKVDREGRVMAEKRNEAGKKITNKMKDGKQPDSIFKKWQQRTHLTLQKSGEIEDQKAIEQAKRANDSRRQIKEFRQRHGAQLYKGQDPKSHNTLIDKKKQKMMNKIKLNKEKNQRGGKQSGGRQYGEKALKKIEQSQRPSRSKMIVKKKSIKKR